MIQLLRYGIGLGILLFTLSGVGYAQDPAVADIFRDGFYGGLAGALVGVAAILFDIDDAEDHLNYIAIGAGVGVIGGTAYGIYSATQAFAEIEGSRTTWHLPVPQIVRKYSSNPSRDREVIYAMPLLRVHF